MAYTLIRFCESVPPLMWLARRLAVSYARRHLQVDTDHLRRESIAHVRDHLRALGYPIEQLTDEEIEAGAIALRRSFGSAGVTVEEFSTGFKRLTRSGLSVE